MGNQFCPPLEGHNLAQMLIQSVFQQMGYFFCITHSSCCWSGWFDPELCKVSSPPSAETPLDKCCGRDFTGCYLLDWLVNGDNLPPSKRPKLLGRFPASAFVFTRCVYFFLFIKIIIYLLYILCQHHDSYINHCLNLCGLLNLLQTPNSSTTST